MRDYGLYALASWRTKAKDRQVAMRVTGHKTEATFTRYQIVKTERVREALEALQRHREE